ncbi:ATP-binding protein [Tuwongella immobilis]|uniref:Uncharacterized protein n=1 Tax=Tuwongella immobilis TaxID=692036 RepID=A0A6C2YKR4_9BACT|nr:DUF853 family protein [Tuwongella immobilis]VIP01502.1 Uncharacterized protein OS=Methanocella paludicola (strain DSM 17711 / JCM 13418 / NBRC 101707 / SANAE) GN=MCP_0432 PE=4 SV=1: AAA_10 [Tuwongella immobilis]VTR98598.1 Uncharacterized protein OS=Methanocella paludicola (strain DSM 17711 / JCM 13418 / NBRC 101707 / SANAE) GN=MCP_0432 PE=4 SV=1: AAA_10 [Tuwongella immobilis]
MSDFDIELPACFYLGREYDIAKRAIASDRDPLMMDARDLLTHGVIVGMTGSGKTGLALSVLEEAAIDSIPCIILDVKGDLTNLLLQFPETRPQDYLPWIDPEDARRQGMTPPELAASIAERTRKGLADTLQSPERIQRFRDSAEYRIYTPGSDAGHPLSILKQFTAPVGKIARELLNQKIDAAASALLGLTGIVSDPVQSREHILIAQILLHAWNRGEDLDLADLINRIQLPPMDRIGAFDIETFYPEKDRLKLAVSLNNILASPSFSTWIEGDALDLSSMLESTGKPRHLIFYLAHLNDTQRMFFLTLLLDEILSWTRKQPGTTNLRALVYFDEVFGYLPPHPANPPTKAPLMTLMKQARAFGVGVLLATQNPVDIDYKALSNAGTWMIGKLQTERDKARLMDGLESVAAERGSLTDRNYLEQVISSLGNRVFLLHSVHRPKPVVFQTRYALSFLRGPMTRDQIAKLVERESESASAEPPLEIRQQDDAFKVNLLKQAPPPVVETAPSMPAAPSGIASMILPLASEVRSSAPPKLPGSASGLPELTMRTPQAAPAASPTPASAVPVGRTLHYLPRLLGFATVHFVDKRRNLELQRTYRFLAEAPATGQSVFWTPADQLTDLFATTPQPKAEWGALPEGFTSARKFASYRKELNDTLYREAKLALLENEELDLRSEPGEDVAQFIDRCRVAARQRAEREIATAAPAIERKLAPLRAKLPTPPPPAPPEPTNLVGKLFGWMFPGGRPSPSKIVVSEHTPAEKAALKAKADYDQILAEWEQRKAFLLLEAERIAQQYAEILLKPRKTDIAITQFGLAWTPHWQLHFPDGRSELRPAF